MRIALRLLGFLKPLVGEVLLSILLSAATVASSIGLLGTSAFLISSAALHPSIADLQVAIVGVRFFGISRGVLRYLERLVSHSVNFRVLARLRVWFYKRLEPLAPAGLEDQQGGSLLDRAIGDIETLENFYVRALAPIISALVITAGMGWFLGRFAAMLGWVLAAGMAVNGILLPLLVRRMSQVTAREASAARAKLSGALVEAVQGMDELLVLDQEQRTAARIAQLSRDFSFTQEKVARNGALGNAGGLLVSSLTLWVILLLAIPLVRGGSLEGVSLAVVVLLALASFEAVAPLNQAAQHLENSFQSAKRIFDLADKPAKVIEPVMSEDAPGSAGLEIKDLSFGYAPGLPLALERFCLDLPPGKKVALVGPSGAGKTTLARLLFRFWDCPPGTIFLNGKDIRAYHAEDVRRLIAVVPQKGYLFNASLHNNLSLVNPGAGRQDLETAARQAGLNDLLRRMPEGLDSWPGDRGTQLSGGERQRILIARALLKAASLLILDEPTAGLDAVSARELMDTLWESAVGRSVLYITHDLIDLEKVDEILVLVGGKVVERGSHTELAHAGGWYAQAWRLQKRILDVGNFNQDVTV